MASVNIAEFVRLAATKPYTSGLDWGDLVARLTAFSEREHKDGPGWSPTVYAAGASRGNENVLAITAAVIDVDHEEPEWSLLNAFEYVAHTTYSHTEADPHWRVILPFSVPVNRSDWRRTWRKIQFWLAPSADEACKDESRFYWWPTCRPGAPREVRHHEGRFLDPDTLRDLPEQQPTLRIVDRPVGEPDANGERPGDRFARETDWSEILRGWRLLSTRGQVRKWERPENGIPKQTPGCSATTGGGGHDVLYVFSSNAQPFDPNTSYTKFRAYSLIEHGGDDKAAASALGERYREDAGGPIVEGVDGDDWGFSSPKAAAPSDDWGFGSPKIDSHPGTPYEVFSRPISELLSQPDVEPDWMVDQLFTVGSNGWVAAEPKVGKSWIVLELAYALTTGSPFLGRFAVKQPRRVLYIQEEDTADRVKRRLKRLIKGDATRLPPSDEYFRYVIRLGFKLDSLPWMERLHRDIVEHRPEVVIMDVFNRLHGADENNQKEMTELLNRLIRLNNDYGCSFLLVHHNKKAQAGLDVRANQMIRGSGVLAGWAECSLYLRRSKIQNTIIVTPESKDAPELDDFTITLTDTENGGMFLEMGDDEGVDRGSRADTAVLDAVRKLAIEGRDATVQEIARVLGKERSGVQKRVAALVNGGHLTCQEIQMGRTFAKLYSVTTL